MPLTITQEQALSCCASPLFAQRLAARCTSSGGFRDFGELVDAARSIWWNEVGVAEWLAAFAAHPKIGDKKGHEGKPADFAAFSKGEQAAAAQSVTSEVEQELRRWNEAYLAKHGFIFIIFAKGRTSPEILAALKERYARPPHEELGAAAREQMRITELRLGGVFNVQAELELQARAARRADQVLNQLTASHTNTPLRSPITTHVLDAAMGVPAEGLPLQLLRMDEHSGMYERLTSGVTNEDGRVGNLLPPSNYLAPGRYRMHFDTATYLRACKQRHPAFYADVPFYPEVAVDFEISADKATEHYHIPLLLSPYSYSTYRGS